MDPRLARFAPGNCERLVVKIGSSLLVDQDGQIRRRWLETVLDDVGARLAAGQRVAIVSSGAIALGAKRLGLTKGGRASLEDAQAAAATGQIALSQAYAELLAARGQTAAQMLVTLDDLEDRRRFLNASATLDRLLSLGAVPVLNENDSVATAEIRFGDNDRLAARVAQAASAGGVILLSDIDGLYTANPSLDPTARRVETVENIDTAIEAMADDRSGSGLGSGGMVAKLQAARIATAAGVHLAIIDGRLDHPLANFDQSGRGTVFFAMPGASAKKAWLAGRLTVRGTIHIDAGAAAALTRGNSLLAAGATRVEGKFERGDPVEISGPTGPLARGLAGYDNLDTARILGTRNDAQAAMLGYAPRAALVHRDHLVML